VVAILASTLNGHTNVFSASGNLLLTLLILELTPVLALLIYRVGFDGGTASRSGERAVLRWPIATSSRLVRMTASAPSSAFAGFRFPREVITVALRWYLRYGLSYPGR
jgi:hypothetical protein